MNDELGAHLDSHGLTQARKAMFGQALYNNGNVLSYAEYGDQNGDPILVQHGLIASIRDDQLFARLVEAGARVICIARPGYGDSSPYEMRAIAEYGEIISVLVDELGLSQFDVLGISSGAPYSYAIDYRLPDRVRNLFILSGVPALYDESIRALWPHPTNENASLAELQTSVYEFFFSGLSQEELDTADIKESMANNCFGVAQDLKLRCRDWGFTLSEVKARVHMRHSKTDDSVPFITAEMTARLLPDCRLDVRENDVHFSQEVLDDFIDTVMTTL